jgi:hypothetical protein
MKIYNEIAIDMNPESSSYEEVLYEDSFEHEGQVMLLQRTEEDVDISSEEYIKFHSEGIAADIDYDKFAPFIDSQTGEVTNPKGMLLYLQTLPQFRDLEDKEIWDLMRTMPNLSINQSDLAAKRSQFQSDIYGLQSKIGGTRKKAESQQAASGVYNPMSTGFGGNESFAEGLYGQIETETAGVGGMYGLEEEMEKTLYDWALRSTEGTGTDDDESD